MNGTNVRNLAPSEAVEAKRSWDELFNIVKVKRSQSMRLGGMQKVGERSQYVAKITVPNSSES